MPAEAAPTAPRWKRLLFYELTSIDVPLRDLLRRRREERRRFRPFAADFAGRWTPRLLTLLALAVFVCSLVPGAYAQMILAAAVFVFSAAMCFYFGRILLRRMQCSLLEFCAIIAMLGNIEGLLVSSGAPRALNIYVCPLALLLAVWVLYGAVRGIAMARLLNATAATQRLGLLAAAWLIAAAPALLIAGGFLAFMPRHGIGAYVTPAMARWGIPLILAGLAGAVLHFRLHRRAARAALEWVKPPAACL